jgi:hypothetical protein
MHAGGVRIGHVAILPLSARGYLQTRREQRDRRAPSGTKRCRPAPVLTHQNPN